MPRLSDDAITKHRLEGITGKLREIVAARQPYATDDPPMEKRYSILDRLKASDGYSTANTRLLCARHDMEAQQAKNYTETGGYVRHDGDP